MISKRVLFLAAAVLLASTAGAWAAGVNVDNFQVANLNIVSSSDYLNLKSTASYGIVSATEATPVPTAFSTIDGYLDAGYAGGLWDGLGGINSSPAAADALESGYTTLANFVGQDAMDNLGAYFHGHEVAAEDTLIMYTYYGDSDGDGAVTDGDYGFINYGYEEGLTGFIWGDYDRDGAVTDGDYGYINYLYDEGGAPAGTLGGGFTWSVAAAGRLAPVPEPSTLVLLALTGVCALAAFLRKR